MPRRRPVPLPKLTDRQRRIRYAFRRARWPAVVLAVLAGLLAADRAGWFGRRPESDWNRYHGKTFRVVNVVDGDTLDIGVSDGPHDRTRVRLWGVDTPETKHPAKPVGHFGPESAEFTRRACHGRDVTVQLVAGRTRDSHQRLLAYITLPDGTMLNRELVRQGYGYADTRYGHPYLTEFQQLMNEARKAGRGLWEQARDEDLPYYLREGQRPVRH